MKKSVIQYLITLTFAISLLSCQKEISSHPGSKAVPDQRLVYRTPNTMQEVALVNNLKKTTDILKELYKNKAHLKLVNASIFSKAYTDATILLKDLIYPETSILRDNKKFQKYCALWNVNLSSFSHAFWSEVEKSGDSEFTTFLQGLAPASKPNSVTNFVNGDDVSIYFPYAELYVEEGGTGATYDPITSIVTATADADEGLGSMPFYFNGVFQYYLDVLVNDDFAETHPTQIVGVNGVDPYNPPPDANAAFPPGDPIDLPNLPREVKQVYVGDVRCRKQYDALISFTGNGGGSEIRFTRADGFLKVNDGQVQADMFVTGDGSISRYNIRKSNWVDFSNEWDGDWEATNFQQNLAIYEEDNRNTSSFSGSLGTTLTWPAAGGSPGVTVAGTIGFTINYKSDDAIIKQTNYNRDVFFILNRVNLEGEMHNSWPVRDKNANVSFTLNDRTFF